MSTPKSLALDERVRREDTSTERGTFATLSCAPRDTSLPYGSALLIPGFTGSKEDFAALLPLLAESGWQAATYDQRGQFETKAAADDDFSLAGLTADALSLARAFFGAEELVHLVGHSFGGLVAGEAALSHPSRWASLTLMCSGPGAVDDEQAQAALDGARIVEVEGLEAAYEANSRRNRERGFPSPPPEIERFLHRRFLSNSPQSLAAIARHLALTPNRTTDLADLDMPVHVIRGEDDTWPHSDQDDLAAALDTRVVVIADAAHSPAVEAPERTRDALVRCWLG